MNLYIHYCSILCFYMMPISQHALETIWANIADILDPCMASEHRQLVLHFLKCLIIGQVFIHLIVLWKLCIFVLWYIHNTKMLNNVECSRIVHNIKPFILLAPFKIWMQYCRFCAGGMWWIKKYVYIYSVIWYSYYFPFHTSSSFSQC